MIKKNQHVTKGTVLREQAAQVRVKAVESQLSLALTLCVTAEVEIRSAENNVARKLIRKLRHHAKEISFHLDEPGHLPKTDIPNLRQRLTLLEQRIGKIDAKLRQC